VRNPSSNRFDDLAASCGSPCGFAAQARQSKNAPGIFVRVRAPQIKEPSLWLGFCFCALIYFHFPYR